MSGTQHQRVGRYLLSTPIGSGGMATVHLGRLLGAAGFSRTVAVKKLHPYLAKDSSFVSMFVDEARLAARIRHPNVVGTLDVVQLPGELLIVMDYIHGVSLYQLIRNEGLQGRRVPPEIAVSVLVGTLQGLHAAHGACNELGKPLGIVHRDVSPQNILVGVDGLSHVVDFGIALAGERIHVTRTEALKGKVGYMSKEQVLREKIDHRADVYAAAVVLWETLTGERLFAGDVELARMQDIVAGAQIPPGAIVPGLPGELDRIVMRGLHTNPALRH